MILPDDDDLAALAEAARLGADYRRDVAAAERHPVADYATIHARFDRAVPDAGIPATAAIAELVDGVRDGLRANTSPRFFGWVTGHSHPAGVAADWLTSAWGQNVAGIAMAPGASAVEAVVARWLVELLHLPPESSVGIVSGATLANTVCLAAARGSLLARAGWDAEADGLFGAPPIPVLISADAHSTVFVALRHLGLGENRVQRIATDAVGRMIPDALGAALAGCAAPPLVIAQAGQINTGVSDRFATIAPMVDAAGGWLHVDGAFGLWGQASPQHRHLSAGVEAAHSWATDGHKWLQTPYDCGFAIVRDAAAHRKAMDITASYLAPPDPAERHPGAYVPELSRRARGFAAWTVIRRLGRSGIAQMVSENVRLAQRMAEGIAQMPGAAVPVMPELNQFVVRFGGEGEAGDRATQATIDAIQRDAVAFMGPARWRGALVMRVSVCSIATTDTAVDQTLDAVRRAWDAVRNT